MTSVYLREEAEISTRVQRVLDAAGLSIEEALQMAPIELGRIPNLGAKGVTEILTETAGRLALVRQWLERERPIEELRRILGIHEGGPCKICEGFTTQREYAHGPFLCPDCFGRIR